MLEHVEGYAEVPRAGACLDSAGFQISGCAFKHGGELCMGVVCAAAERADGKYVMFIPMADATPSANLEEHDEPRGAPVICEPAASMPRAGEFIIAVWEGTCLNQISGLSSTTPQRITQALFGVFPTLQRKASLTR